MRLSSHSTPTSGLIPRSAAEKLMWRPLRRVMRRLFEMTFGRAIDARVRNQLLYGRLIFGDPARVSVSATAVTNNALFNTVSGCVVVEDYAFLGHNVCLLTGTHDVASLARARQLAMPESGRDILVKTGAWVASNATVLGPCVIGEHAVVAAGAVVVGDVPPYTIVGGVPARVIGQVPRPRIPAESGAAADGGA